MGSLPKPLIGLLLATVAFFALWMVALKPSSSSSSGSQGGVGQYQSAVNQAHQAATTSNRANAKLGAPTATTTPPKSATSAPKPATKATPATKAKTAAAPATSPKAKTADKPAPASTAAEVKTVVNAVRDHKVLAVLFYNPAAADDQTMVKELGAIPTAKGKLVKVSVPVSQLTNFAVITAKVPVVTSPTLVIVDTKGQATTLTGFAGTGEIHQRLDDALAAK
jgi:hypothetical protein